MKLISQEELKKLVVYNTTSGIFTWKVSLNRNKVIGSVVGTKTKGGYIQIRLHGVFYLAHRLAFLYKKGYLPENDIDHIDRIAYHNWWDNLREVTPQCNIRNTGNFAHNKSGVKGVCFYKKGNTWKSTIMINKKQLFLGYHTDFDEAVCHRLAAEQCVGWEGCDSHSPAYQHIAGMTLA